RQEVVPPPAPLTSSPGRGLDPGVHVFRAWTESLLITGRLRADDRLSDALNRRDQIRVEGPVVTPIGATAEARYQALEMSVDPFDLEVVLAGRDVRTAEER